MKYHIFILLITLCFSACQKEKIVSPEFSDLKHLENKLLIYTEGKDGSSTFEYPEIPVGNVFNVYINGIQFNSDGTFELYFSGYDLDSQKYEKLEFTKELDWEQTNDEIVLETPRIDNFQAKWILKEVKDDNIVVAEVYEDKELEYTLMVK